MSTFSIEFTRDHSPDVFRDFVWSEYQEAYVYRNHSRRVIMNGDGDVSYIDTGSDLNIQTCGYSGNAFLADECDHFTVVETGDLVLREHEHNYFCWPDGTMHNQPRNGVRAYHSQQRVVDSADSANPFVIGVEVEKEDGEVRSKLNAGDIVLPNGWVVEEDASLTSGIGYEIVTRAYNLKHLNEFKRDILSCREAINAEFTKKCGGHITVSRYGYSDVELAETIKPLFPLLMALYPKRMESSYVTCKRKKDLAPAGRIPSKYSPFYYRGDRIEFRIPSGVRNVKTMKWRLDLFAYVLRQSKEKNLTWEWARREMGNGKLRQMLNKAYCVGGNPDTDQSGALKVQQKVELFYAFAQYFHTNKPPREVIAHYVATGERFWK